MSTMTKKCTKCEEVKPLEDFPDRDGGKKRARCRECMNRYHRERYQKNPGGTAKRRAELMRTNPQKVIEDDRRWRERKRSIPQLPPLLRAAVLKAYEECAACGTTDSLTVDHIKPTSAGGKHDWDNLQVLCLSCNCKKWTREIDYRKAPVAEPNWKEVK